MDDEDISSLHKQIASHKRNLRILEEQAASFGKLYCPPYISTSIEDTRKEIQELEQKIYGEIQSSSPGGDSYSPERVREIYERTAQIASLERGTYILRGLIKISKSLLYWKDQDMDVRLLTILIAIIMLNSTWQGFVGIVNNIPNGSIIAAIVAVIAVFLLIFAGKKLTKIYELVRELDEKLQEDEAELQYHKSELDKIYKVAE